MKKFLFVSLLITVCAVSYAQTFSVSFDTSSQFVIIDTSATNLWQVGTPTKCFFGDYWNGGKAIMIDTTNFYPPNNISSFILKLPFSVCGLCGLYLSFKYNLDADSLRDGGYVEYSNDDGANWYNLRNVFTPWGLEIFDDTLYDGTPGITGLHKYWETYTVVPCFFSNYSPPEFRFVFKSDSIDNQRCGWVISYISASLFVCEGIEEINTHYHFASVYPNPVAEISSLQIKNENQKIESIQFFNSLGVLVKTISRPHQNNFPILKKYFSEGMYLFRVQLTNGKIDEGKFTVE